MPKTTMLLCLLFLLVSMPVFTHAAEESHPSLKQLIAESKEQNRWQHWSMTTDVHFEPTEVRKKFFGNETAFLRELAVLLQDESLYKIEGAGRDRDKVSIWDVHQFLVFLDIDDETIFKIVRDKFLSFDLSLQMRFCNILGKNPSNDNIEFLVKILKQTDLSVHLRRSAAYALSYLLTGSEEYFFVNRAIEQKNSIIDAFLFVLNDETEYRDFYDQPYNLGNHIASLCGYFGTFAEPALPIIKQKFNAIQDNEESERADIEHKMALAGAIVCIDPKLCSAELEYILQKATNDESEDIRCYAIWELEMMPAALSEKVIPCLQIVIQKDASTQNKIEAAEAMKAMLERQLENEDVEEDEEDIEE